MSAVGSRAIANPGEQGVTLLEMLVVLAILALISALAFPQLGRARDTIALRRSAVLLVSDLHEARAAAIRTGMAAGIAVSRDGRAYRRAAGGLRMAPDGVAFAAANGGTDFFADGSTSGGRFSVIGMGRRMDVLVDPVTGSIATSDFR
ncbi:MAG: prepilin-type N-terminal cleavage/methylation domain-containing protein [Rhizomicrobium sp.]